MSAAQYAIYAVGILNVPLAGTMVRSVGEVMLIRVSKAYADGDLNEMKRVWYIALERLAVVFVPSVVLAMLVAPDLFVLLFGASYLSSAQIFRVFLISLLLLAIVDHGILRATADTPYLVKANVVGFFVSLVALLVLTRVSVLFGAITAYVLGLAAMRVMGLARVAQRLELGWRTVVPWRSLLRITAAALAAAAIAAAALVLPYLFLRLLVASACFAAVYAFLVIRWKMVSPTAIRSFVRRLALAARTGS